MNKLIIIGNGFDLAHGLKTSYRDFLDWYMSNALQEYRVKYLYRDSLIELSNANHPGDYYYERRPETLIDVMDFFDEFGLQIQYKSNFFKRLVTQFHSGNWIDLECFYFRILKSVFLNRNINQTEAINKINAEFDFIVKLFGDYIKVINAGIEHIPALNLASFATNLGEAFKIKSSSSEIRFLNFNYTDLIPAKEYGTEKETIYIHGRASDRENNPIIFGYGDETDPVYQKIEDSGKNMYLEHIKSFGYFLTKNYHTLLYFLQRDTFEVYVVGHSCGLSDRVLLSEIFEHPNCRLIDIFYYQKPDGTDNFKEITQEISRHFRPQNKSLMRRRIRNKNTLNIIPQNHSK